MLLGATAVEDKLQEDAIKTIEDLQKASIKVWMLTGDKFETAENVGLSCRLIDEHFVLFKIRNFDDLESVCSQKTLERNRVLQLQGKKRALVVDAKILPRVLLEDDFRLYFTLLAKSCDSVICARMNPSQKAEVVKLIKKDDGNAITAAIGDGANDVNMILEAHVGIGLFGNEGLRAVQAADFSISQFRFLWPLLLQNGRKYYKNNATLINYFLYKNLVFTMPQLYFGCFNGFSG